MNTVIEKRIVAHKTNKYNKLSWIAFLLMINFVVKAEIITTEKSGDFDQQEIWFPQFPGNVIKETDTIIISKAINQNIDIVVKGTIIISEGGSLNGSNDLLISKSGTLFNLGNSEFAILTNRGAIYNEQVLTVTLDFVNSGNIINYNDIAVGNKLDNTGKITGKGGRLSADRKFVNSRTGTITGNMDVCSNNFLNVEGGVINTETTTFCGNNIFSNQGMLSMNDPLHFEKAASAVSLRTGEYEPF